MQASILEECKHRLLFLKEDILNRLSRKPPVSEDTGGDFADLNVRALNENEWILLQTRARQQIHEIEAALSRIQSGTYGICEETGAPIEAKRLLALPWTRLSVEGASARETSKN